MSEFFDLLMRIAVILFAALEAYDKTPEGHQAIESLLSDIEDAGFDIPFWEPDPNQEPLDMSNAEVAAQGLDLLKAHFLHRHPEVAAREAAEQQGSNG